MGLKLEDKNAPALQLASSILSGQGGRLFLKLRDEQSLAYTVAPIEFYGIEPGYFGIYIGCAPEKVAQAQEGIQKELDLISSKTPPKSEVERSKRYLLGRLAIDSQRNSSIATSMAISELVGEGFDHQWKFPELMQKVTPENVRQVTESVFSGNSVTSIVSPS